MPNGLLFKGAIAFVAFIGLALSTLVWTRSSPLFVRGSGDPGRSFQDQFTSEIRGIDLDRNGIRDDVEQWIRGRFDATGPDRKALLQLAADYQTVLLTTANPQASRVNLLKLSESLRCVRYVLGADAEEEIARFKAVVLDTDLRVRAWLKAYDRLTGMQAAPDSAPSASSCRFAL